METANFVMTYASKSPQRDSGGPVRIFNMQVGTKLVIVILKIKCTHDNDRESY